MTSRKYCSHAEWLSIFQQYKDSGLTPAEFYQQQSLDHKYFLKRKRSLESQADAELQRSAFVKVHSKASKQVAPAAELALQYQNMTLSISIGADPLWLAQLMTSLS